MGCPELLREANRLLARCGEHAGSLEAQLASARSQSSALSSHITVLESTVSALDGSLREAETRLRASCAENALLRKTCADRAAQLATLEATLAAMARQRTDDAGRMAKQEKELEKLRDTAHQNRKRGKMLFGRSSEKVHGAAKAPPALVGAGIGGDDLDRIKAIFDKTGYGTLEKRDRGCPSLERQGLPVVTVYLDVDGLPPGSIPMGETRTDKAVYVKERFYIRRYIRYAYLCPEPGKGHGCFRKVKAPLPPDVEDTGRVGADVAFQARLVTDRYRFGIPTQRQNRRFAACGTRFPDSNLYDWTAAAISKPVPLYEQQVREVISSGLAGCDETRFPVIDHSREKGRKLHIGQQWVLVNPVLGTALFRYGKGRGHADAESLLGGFRGHMLTDALPTYGRFGKKEGVTHGKCLTHGRRLFVDARDSDFPRARQALEDYINPLYAIERDCTREGLDFDAVTERRQRLAVPILEAFHAWLLEQRERVIPRSPIARAIRYMPNIWDGVMLYTTDGMYMVDNNHCERVIREVAVGRKSSMFAASHESAQRVAIAYTFTATCKLQGVDFEEWLTDALTRIDGMKTSQLHTLLPQYWKKDCVA